MARRIDLFGDELPLDDGEISGSVSGRPKSVKRKDLVENLKAMRADYLLAAFKSIYDRNPSTKLKAGLVDILGATLDFGSREDFDAFMTGLTPLARSALALGTFNRFVRLGEIEADAKAVFKRRDRFSFSSQPDFEERAGLGMFLVVNESAIFLPYAFRLALKEYLPQPAEWNPVPVEPEGEPYSFEALAGEAFTLLAAETARFDPDVLLKKGLAKGERARMEGACGAVPFPVASGFGLSSAELAARAYSAFAAVGPSKARGRKANEAEGIDGIDGMKNLFKAFFSRKDNYCGQYNPSGAFFEFRVLTQHLAKRPGVSRYEFSSEPATRKTLSWMLGTMKDGSWYSIRDLFMSAYYRDLPVSIIFEPDDVYDFKLKAERLELDGAVYDASDYADFGDGFNPLEPFTNGILNLPMFKAYFYLLAAFGMVELRELQPRLAATQKGVKMPISPFDPAHHARLTPLGAWCLGLSGDRPAPRASSGVALADPNLPILTIKGESLRIRSFLESVGKPMGEGRYRVTEASFVSGCVRPGEIETRVRKFKELVSGEVPGRWQEMFRSIREKARAMETAEPAVLLRVPDSDAARALFLSDPALRKYALRAEGGYVAVRNADWGKVAKALEANGYLIPK